MGTPSKTIFKQLSYLHAKFGTFVQRVMIFSLSHLTNSSHSGKEHCCCSKVVIEHETFLWLTLF